MKKKLTYDDIKLMGSVKLPFDDKTGTIMGIDNFTHVGIDEPIFAVKECGVNKWHHFGLKYIIKHYIPQP